VGQTSSFQCPDAFRQSGLGRAAFQVIVTLQGGPLEAKAIAEKTGRHVQTVRKSLAKMKQFGLVERKGRLWHGLSLSEIDLKDLAKSVGTDGALQKQREKHKAERRRREISNSILRKYRTTASTSTRDPRLGDDKF